jgi:PhnB protein
MKINVNPYLNFNGNTEEAFNFYKSVFGGEFFMLMRYKETPEAEKVTEEEKDKIMHMSLPLGDGNVLMGTDMLESLGHKVVIGGNITLSLDLNTKEDADKIFNSLSDGGKINMPMSDTFWGAYFGMLRDKFGIMWMVSFDKNR